MRLSLVAIASLVATVFVTWPLGAATQDAGGVSRPVQQTDRATLKGRVLAAEDARPLSGASVTLIAANGTVRTARSDDAGRFVFEGLLAGQYQLSATKFGYLRAAYGQHAQGAPGAALELVAGTTEDNVVRRLSRAVLLSGKVVDENGDPPSAGEVQALQRVISSVGQQKFDIVGRDAIDSRGGFRIGSLPGGQFVLRFVSTTSEPYAAYYPGTPSFAEALPIAAEPGQERVGLDIPVRISPLATVSGTVLEGGVPVKGDLGNSAVLLIGNGPDATPVLISRTRIESGGRFTIGGVPQGTYELVALADRPAPQFVLPRGESTSGPAGVKGLAILGSAQSSGRVSLTVAGGIVGGVEVHVTPGVPVTGRVVADAGAAASAFEGMHVRLVPVGAAALMSADRAVAAARVQANGEFLFPAVAAGDYAIEIPDAPNGWVPKSASFGGREILDLPLAVGTNVDAGLVVMSRQSAGVSGMLKGAQGRPLAGYSVILFSTDERYWTPGGRRLQTTTTSMWGHYAFEHVAPGDYRIAVVSAPQPFEWYNASYLRDLSKIALPISVREAEQKVYDVAAGR